MAPASRAEGIQGAIIAILIISLIIVLYRMERLLSGVNSIIPEFGTTLKGINGIMPDIKYIADSAKNDVKTVNKVQDKVEDVLDFL